VALVGAERATTLFEFDPVVRLDLLLASIFPVCRLPF